MSRLTISLATALVLATAGGHPLAAQDAGAVPNRDALTMGVRAFNLRPVPTGAPATVESGGAALDVDAIMKRRDRFVAVGAATGMALATVWAFRKVNVKDGGLGIVALPFVVPILWIPSGAFGAAVGYGVSFLFYPPERANRSML